MFMQAFKQAFGVLAKKPLRLLGLSVLCSVISAIATLVTLPVGIIGTAFTYVLTAGMAKVYLDGLDGKQVYSDQLFEGTKKFFRVAGGMAWKDLWTVIWSLAAVLGTAIVSIIVYALLGFIPVLGMILTILVAVVLIVASCIVIINRSYAYSFVPYILMTQPEVNATEALRVSVKQTKGKILQMWLADIICSLATGIVGGIIAGLMAATSRIPFIGGLFLIVYIVYFVAVLVFVPIFKGLYYAAFYKLPKPAPKQNNMYNQFNNQFQQPQYQAQGQPQYQAQGQPQYQAPQQPQYQAPAQPQYQAPQQPQYQAPVQPQYQQPQQTQYQQPQQPQNYQQ